VETVDIPVEGKLANMMVANMMVAGLVVGTRGPFLSSQNGKGCGVYVEVVRSKKEWSNIALQRCRLPSGDNNFVEGKLRNRFDVDSSSGRNCCT
jgi:hypothetical protein